MEGKVGRMLGLCRRQSQKVAVGVIKQERAGDMTTASLKQERSKVMPG